MKLLLPLVLVTLTSAAQAGGIYRATFQSIAANPPLSGHFDWQADSPYEPISTSQLVAIDFTLYDQIYTLADVGASVFQGQNVVFGLPNGESIFGGTNDFFARLPSSPTDLIKVFTYSRVTPINTFQGVGVTWQISAVPELSTVSLFVLALSTLLMRFGLSRPANTPHIEA